MLSALAWLPRGAARSIPKAAPPTQDELAEAARLAAAAAARGGGGKGRSGGSDDHAASASSSEWETDDEEEEEEEDDDDSGMEEDAVPVTPEPDLARAKRAAARLKAEGSAPAKTGDPGLDAAMAALDMENYDNEDEEAAGGSGDEGGSLDGEGNPASSSRRVLDGLFGGDDALYYASNAEDPYIALARGAEARGAGAAEEEEEEEGEEGNPAPSDSEEGDAWELRPTDFVLAAARSEDDVSTLEVWVYESGDVDKKTGGRGPANLYVHHDLLLGAFPLSLAWLDCPPGGGGGGGGGGGDGDGSARANFVAVGTMDPGVELWDLDAADAVAPVVTLGGGGAGKKGSKKGRPSKRAAAAGGGHAGAVLGLAWNAAVRNVLASASADHTVKVWDIAAAGGGGGGGEGGTAASCPVVATLAHHTDKVQALAWHPTDPAVLLSGGFDKQAILADVRAPGAAGATAPPSWGVGADVEALAWNLAAPTEFCVAGEDGHVTCFDARKGSGAAAARFTLAAHNRPATGLAFAGPAAPGLLATGSTDKKVKLWDVAGGAPALVEAADLKVGAVFALAFAGDAALPGILAAAGAKGMVAVWEVGAADAVAERWPALKV